MLEPLFWLLLAYVLITPVVNWWIKARTPLVDRFDAAGKDKFQLRIDKIRSVDDDGYSVSTYGRGTDGGFEFMVWGAASSLWFNEEKKIFDEIRVSIKFESSSFRQEMQKGVIGGGRIENDEYYEIGLDLDHDYVRDILFELRRNPNRGVRIDGVHTAPTRFRVVHFVMWENRESK